MVSEETRSARGAGVLVDGGGELEMGRTIVADNKGVTIEINPNEAQLSKEQIVFANNHIVQVGGTVLPVVVADGVEGLPGQTVVGQIGHLGPDNESYSTALYTITLENRDIYAFDSTVSTAANNFVAATTLSVFDHGTNFQDQWGTPQNPLKLGSVGYLAMNGGKTPTLKLKDSSPARHAFVSERFTTQNGHEWTLGSLKDIDAWGGPVNRAPVAQEVVFEMVQGGQLVLTAEDLLVGTSDANGDPLFVKGGEWSELGSPGEPPNTDGVDFRGLHSNAAISRQTGNVVGTGPNVLIDNSFGHVAEITYKLDPDDPFTGDEQFTYWGSDGQTQTPVTATIRVISKFPAVTSISRTTPEDTPLFLDMGDFQENFSDPDGEPLVNVTIESLPEAGGHLEFAGEPVVAGQTLPPDAILAFIPEKDFDAGVTFSYSASDGVDSSNVATVTIDVLAVDDAPQILAPDELTGYEDVSLVIQKISVDDVDVGEGSRFSWPFDHRSLEVTLSVNHGALSLSQTSELNFQSGTGTGEASMTFRGTQDAIDAALTEMTYLGDLDFRGTDSLTILVDDLGNTGSGGPMTAEHSVDIAVLSAGQQAGLLKEQISEARNQGELNRGRSKALQNKLNLKGNPGDVRRVERFIKQVNKLQEKGRLADELADDWRAAADTLLASLNDSDRDVGSLAANGIHNFPGVEKYRFGPTV